MEFLPLFFDLKQQPCLLVGGGAEALRKARLLTKARARVHAVDPEPLPELVALVTAAGGSCSRRAARVDDLDHCILAIVATDDEALAARIAGAARRRRLPVNVVDTPALCSFIMPAIIDRSPLVIGVSSGGEAPVLVRQTRALLERLIPLAYGNLAGLASRWRERVKDHFADGGQRRRFWESIFEGPVAELVYRGRDAEADQQLAALLAQSAGTASAGEVYIVGAGPGDAELLTLRALRLMQQADVVLYDHLISPAVMELVRRDADRIPVGKSRDQQQLSQSDINQLLLDLARQGKRVLRLKSGDPFLFGRGAEELELLAAQQIPVQVVPGITAAAGCAAWAGVPLTHKNLAHSVRFLGGPYTRTQPHSPGPDWASMTDPGETLVFYMAQQCLALIAGQLLAVGRSPQTPVMLISNGTRPEQQIAIATLQTLAQLAPAAGIPALLLVGEVVTLCPVARPDTGLPG